MEGNRHSTNTKDDHDVKRPAKAQVASIQLDAGASGEQQEFYQSKIVDFEIFCHNYLTANLGLAESILKFKDSYSSLKI